MGRGVLWSLAIWLGASTAALARPDRFTASVGAGAWQDDERPFHGAVLLAWDRWMPAGHLGVELNTETLRVGFDTRPVDRLELSALLAGELMEAGLAPDYWQDGHLRTGRGFHASYAQAALGAKLRVGERTYLEAILGARRWFFGTTDDTAPGFVLPAEAWVFEPRLRYTWWYLDGDAAWGSRHRLFPRLNGIAGGVELGVDARSARRNWGDRPDDLRNAPETLLVRPRQWLFAGWQADPLFRLQLEERAAFGAGEDDLTRDRLGGLTPYTIPVAGAPWAAWLSERYASTQLSGHFAVLDDLELGPLVTAVVLADPHRRGERNEAGFQWGFGALTDWRLGDWQLDLRGGWSPSLASDADRAAWSVWAAVGWAG